MALPGDAPEPEAGWNTPCRVEDHSWKVEFEAGSYSLIPVDPCSEEAIALMRPGTIPGCHLESEWLLSEVGPFKLKWATDCPRRGYNDSGSHGHGCDCDHWVEIERVGVSYEGTCNGCGRMIHATLSVDSESEPFGELIQARCGCSGFAGAKLTKTSDEGAA